MAADPTTSANRPTVAFISHATADRPFVERHVIAPLQAAGIGVWYCKDDIHTSDKWERKIVEGLKGCTAFVLVMSPRSSASEWVRDELSLALKHVGDARIVPVLIGPCAGEDFHIRVSRLQYLDFTAAPDGRRLVAAVRGEKLPTAAHGPPTRWPAVAVFAVVAMLAAALLIWPLVRPKTETNAPNGPGTAGSVPPTADNRPASAIVFATDDAYCTSPALKAVLAAPFGEGAVSKYFGYALKSFAEQRPGFASRLDTDGLRDVYPDDYCDEAGRGWGIRLSREYSVSDEMSMQGALAAAVEAHGVITQPVGDQLVFTSYTRRIVGIKTAGQPLPLHDVLTRFETRYCLRFDTTAVSDRLTTAVVVPNEDRAELATVLRQLGRAAGVTFVPNPPRYGGRPGAYLVEPADRPRWDVAVRFDTPDGLIVVPDDPEIGFERFGYLRLTRPHVYQSRRRYRLFVPYGLTNRDRWYAPTLVVGDVSSPDLSQLMMVSPITVSITPADLDKADAGTAVVRVWVADRAASRIWEVRPEAGADPVVVAQAEGLPVLIFRLTAGTPHKQ